jgi:hypothetical protein
MPRVQTGSCVATNWFYVRQPKSNTIPARRVNRAVMSKTKFILTSLLLVGLVGLCLYLNRDWFAREPIHITHRVTPWIRAAKRADPTNKSNPVVFSFNKFYRFTEVKVVAAAEITTNKYAHALWHLTTSSNSAFLSSFTYGDRLRGMTPKIKGSVPDPLEPGVTYRLMVETEKGPATHDFSTTARQ